LVAVESFALGEPKTKALKSALEQLELKNVLILLEELDENVYLSSRNLTGVQIRTASNVDPVALIGSDKVLATFGALKKLEGALA
jgi:large subunit ribosomal protein L4